MLASFNLRHWIEVRLDLIFTNPSFIKSSNTINSLCVGLSIQFALFLSFLSLSLSLSFKLHCHKGLEAKVLYNIKFLWTTYWDPYTTGRPLLTCLSRFHFENKANENNDNRKRSIEILSTYIRWDNSLSKKNPWTKRPDWNY